MGFFSLFESNENKKYREIYKNVNENSDYLPYFKVLIPFAEASLMMPRMMHEDLLSNKDKKQISFAYFGGAADLLSQNNNMKDDEAYAFIAVYILITFYDGNYKELGQVLNSFLTLTHNKEMIKIMQKGAMDFSEMLSSDNVDASSLFMRFGKLL